MKTLKYILPLLFLGLLACKKQHTVTIQAQNYTNISDGSHYAGMCYFREGYFLTKKLIVQ